MWFAYSPDRKGEHPQRYLEHFSGVLQADGYAGFSKLYDGDRVLEAACWAHVRRTFVDLPEGVVGNDASNALAEIGDGQSHSLCDQPLGSFGTVFSRRAHRDRQQRGSTDLNAWQKTNKGHHLRQRSSFLQTSHATSPRVTPRCRVPLFSSRASIFRNVERENRGSLCENACARATLTSRCRTPASSILRVPSRGRAQRWRAASRLPPWPHPLGSARRRSTPER